MARELRENRFDVEACCVAARISSGRNRNGSPPLVLPNLKLKVLVEAVRMVLDAVYDERFEPQRFERSHVEKLCFFIERKVKDGVLLYLVKRLFECKALVIELGGNSLGRGFPQECGLCSVLINIYFDGFDKEIQGIRLRENRENRELNPELNNASGLESGVFYKPVKVYAVR